MAAKDLFSQRKPRSLKLERAVQKSRPPAPRILLVCEGEKTEPSYFKDMINSLRLSNQVKIGSNNGSSPDKVVARAVELFDSSKSEGDAFDEVYCIFDSDAHEHFNKAVSRLKELKKSGKPFFDVVSVPCFEFWLLLHFGYTEKPYAAKGKKSVGDVLVSDLKTKEGFSSYGKGMKGIFSILISRMDAAIKNAKKLQENSRGDGDYSNPSTQVHILVERLKYISKDRS